MVLLSLNSHWQHTTQWQYLSLKGHTFLLYTQTMWIHDTIQSLPSTSSGGRLAKSYPFIKTCIIGLGMAHTMAYLGSTWHLHWNAFIVEHCLLSLHIKNVPFFVHVIGRTFVFTNVKCFLYLAWLMHFRFFYACVVNYAALQSFFLKIIFNHYIFQKCSCPSLVMMVCSVRSNDLTTCSIQSTIWWFYVHIKPHFHLYTKYREYERNDGFV